MELRPNLVSRYLGMSKKHYYLIEKSNNIKSTDAICEEILMLIDLNIFKFHSPNTVFNKIDGWQYAPMHMIFTIKQEDLRHTARLVINGSVVGASSFNKYFQ